MTITQISDSLKADGYLVIYNPLDEVNNYVLSGNGILKRFNAESMNDAVVWAHCFLDHGSEPEMERSDPIPEDRPTMQLKWVYDKRGGTERVLQQLWMVWDHEKKTITPEWRSVPEFEE